MMVCTESHRAQCKQNYCVTALWCWLIAFNGLLVCMCSSKHKKMVSSKTHPPPPLLFLHVQNLYLHWIILKSWHAARLGWIKSAHDRNVDWFLSTEMSLPALESFATSCPHSLWFTAVTLASLITQTAEFHSRELQWLSAEQRDKSLRHGREWVEKNGTWPNYMIWTENRGPCLQRRNKKTEHSWKRCLTWIPLNARVSWYVETGFINPSALMLRTAGHEKSPTTNPHLQTSLLSFHLIKYSLSDVFPLWWVHEYKIICLSKNRSLLFTHCSERLGRFWFSKWTDANWWLSHSFRKERSI